jgi:hypothetical protein
MGSQSAIRNPKSPIRIRNPRPQPLSAIRTPQSATRKVYHAFSSRVFSHFAFAKPKKNSGPGYNILGLLEEKNEIAEETMIFILSTKLTTKELMTLAM